MNVRLQVLGYALRAVADEMGAALMIVVFASTGGLTGAEIGIAGGSSGRL